MLRGGGYVIVFRHGGTHADPADTDPLNPGHVVSPQENHHRRRCFEP
jgi:hypothetical protein